MSQNGPADDARERFSEEPPDPRILLLLGNDSNRRLVAEHLGQRYDVATGSEHLPEFDDAVDCCLVDVQHFYRHRERLLAAREAAEPRFLPLLLVRSRADDLQGSVWAHVDDVIVPPVGKRELAGRVRTLLRARGHSIALARQNERLDQFAGVLAHDLRTPLSGALAHLDVGRDSGREEHFDRVEDSLLRVAEMVEDLLAVARQGTVVAETEPVDLRRVARTAWRTLGSGDGTGANGDGTGADGGGSRADGDGVQVAGDGVQVAGDGVQVAGDGVQVAGDGVQVDGDGAPANGDGEAAGGRDGGDATPTDGGLVVDDAPTVRADPDRLRTALDNLLRNAREHAGPAPEVRIGPTDGGFYVADDGPGVPEAERETVFEYGESGGDSTGFGLAIVEEVVEAHGWTIEVAESSDGGARFEVGGVEFV